MKIDRLIAILSLVVTIISAIGGKQMIKYIQSLNPWEIIFWISLIVFTADIIWMGVKKYRIMQRQIRELMIDKAERELNKAVKSGVDKAFISLKPQIDTLVHNYFEQAIKKEGK